MHRLPIVAVLGLTLLPLNSVAVQKNHLGDVSFNVNCRLIGKSTGEDKKWRFSYGVDVIQESKPVKINAQMALVFSGREQLVSQLNSLMASVGSGSLEIETGLAEFTHSEGGFEFLADNGLNIKLGIGIVLLKDKKIVGQCLRFTE